MDNRSGQERNLKRLYVAVVLATALAIVLNRIFVCSVHYWVGRGFLNPTLIFLIAGLAIPVIPVFVFLVIGLWFLLRKSQVEVQLRWVVLAWYAVLVCVVVTQPRWRTGDEYICKGLAANLAANDAENNLAIYLDKLIGENSQTTNGPPLEITTNSPVWLRNIFPYERPHITYYNWEANKYLWIRVGGHNLMYGIYFGRVPETPLSLGTDSVTVRVNTNLVVFAK